MLLDGGKSSFLIGKLTISMAIFNSYFYITRPFFGMAWNAKKGGRPTEIRKPNRHATLEW